MRAISPVAVVASFLCRGIFLCIDFNTFPSSIAPPSIIIYWIERKKKNSRGKNEEIIGGINGFVAGADAFGMVLDFVKGN